MSLAAPFFAFEKKVDNVKQAINDFKINYPVAIGAIAIAIVPAIMCVCYLMLIGYFRSDDQGKLIYLSRLSKQMFPYILRYDARSA